MPIKHTCPSCNFTGNLPDNAENKKIVCPKCSYAAIAQTNKIENNENQISQVQNADKACLTAAIFFLTSFVLVGWLITSCAGCAPDFGFWNLFRKVDSKPVIAATTVNKFESKKDPVIDITQSLANCEKKKQVLEEVLIKSRSSSSEILKKIKELQAKSTDNLVNNLTVKPLMDTFKKNYRQIKTLEVRLVLAEAAIFNAQIVMRQKELTRAGFSDDELSSIKQELLNGEEILDGTMAGQVVPEITDAELDMILKDLRK